MEDLKPEANLALVKPSEKWERPMSAASSYLPLTCQHRGPITDSSMAIPTIALGQSDLDISSPHWAQDMAFPHSQALLGMGQEVRELL